MKPRVLLLLLLVVGGLVVGLGTLTSTQTGGDDGVATPTPAFADGFRAHLTTVEAAAGALVDLGERRERNLLVVGQRQSAMNAALDATDAWLVQPGIPEEHPAVLEYRAGAALIRQSMADAQSAFLRLDWDGIAAANVTLKQGTAAIAVAEDLLTSPAGD